MVKIYHEKDQIENMKDFLKSIKDKRLLKVEDKVYFYLIDSLYKN
jgi:hypothetical protein